MRHYKAGLNLICICLFLTYILVSVIPNEVQDLTMYDYRFENKFYILLVFRLFVIGANVTAANVTQFTIAYIHGEDFSCVLRFPS